MVRPGNWLLGLRTGSNLPTPRFFNTMSMLIEEHRAGFRSKDLRPAPAQYQVEASRWKTGGRQTAGELQHCFFTNLRRTGVLTTSNSFQVRSNDKVI